MSIANPKTKLEKEIHRSLDVRAVHDRIRILEEKPSWPFKICIGVLALAAFFAGVAIASSNSVSTPTVKTTMMSVHSDSKTVQIIPNANGGITIKEGE